MKNSLKIAENSEKSNDYFQQIMRIVVQFSRKFFSPWNFNQVPIIDNFGTSKERTKKKNRSKSPTEMIDRLHFTSFPSFFGKMKKKKLVPADFFFLEKKERNQFSFCAAAGGVWNTPERRDRRGGGLFRSSILLCPLFFFLFQNFRFLSN